MHVNFTKMHGLGNDFVVIEALEHEFTLDSAQIRRLADRHFGIGFDQLLLVEAPRTDDMDFSYRIFNADGREVEQCGNGARCFARFVYDRGLTDKQTIRVGTRSGIIIPRLHDDGSVTVDMGAPVFDPEKIPFTANRRSDRYDIEVDGNRLLIGALSMGNPHAVLLVDDVDAAPVTTLGPRLENHPRFPQQTNAGFMQVLDNHNIKLRVWERGSGETLACGTGACAASVFGIQQGMLDSPVTVQLRGGRLEIQWQGDEQPVLMRGPTEYVYEGSLPTETL